MESRSNNARKGTKHHRNSALRPVNTLPKPAPRRRKHGTPGILCWKMGPNRIMELGLAGCDQLAPKSKSKQPTHPPPCLFLPSLALLSPLSLLPLDEETAYKRALAQKNGSSVAKKDHKAWEKLNLWSRGQLEPLFPTPSPWRGLQGQTPFTR